MSKIYLFILLIIIIKHTLKHKRGFPENSAGKGSTCNAGDLGSIPGSGRDRLPTLVFLGFPCGSADKESTCNVGVLGLIPGLERSPRGRKDHPLQYSGLENSMDCIANGVTKSWTWLSNFHFHFTKRKSLHSKLGNSESIARGLQVIMSVREIKIKSFQGW